MKALYISKLAVLTMFVTISMALVTSAPVWADDQMQLPPARKIPALTAEDHFPGGCVDCHINMPERNQDERMSTLMARWNKNAGPKLIEKARAVSPAGVKIKGVHPVDKKSIKNIPADCIACHDKNPKQAPPFAPLIHAIHLTGGEASHYLTIFQGECTYCHKMDPKGLWNVPTGAEK